MNPEIVRRLLATAAIPGAAAALVLGGLVEDELPAPIDIIEAITAPLHARDDIDAALDICRSDDSAAGG